MIRIDTVQDIADAFALLRQLRRLTQVDIGDAIGIASSRISRYERGLVAAESATVIAILAAVGYQLAIVPLIETAPETALSASVADQGTEIVSESRVDGSDGATGLSGGAA